jgi:hypothetical protein
VVCDRYNFDVGTVRLLFDDLLLLPGDTKSFQVSFLIRQDGEVNFSFRIILLGTVTSQTWTFHGKAFGDQVKLSAVMRNILDAEKLPYLADVEMPSNTHLTQVLAPVDYVASVSIHHLLLRVEPLLSLHSLDTRRPPALGPQVMNTFQKWSVKTSSVTNCNVYVYVWIRVESRRPLRQVRSFKAEPDPWENIRPILDSVTIETQASQFVRNIGPR